MGIVAWRPRAACTVVILVSASFVALALDSCGDDSCVGRCQIADATLVHVEGFVVTKIQSDCPAIVWLPLAGATSAVVLSGDIERGAPTKPTVCHATVTLDDGAEIPIVVDANIGWVSCCAKGTVLYTTGFQTVVIKAPPGYVPRDAGSDADTRDASSDMNTAEVSDE